MELGFLSLLLQGTFGMVVLARGMPSGMPMTEKVSLDKGDSPCSVRDLLHEVDIFSSLQHHHILWLLQVGRVDWLFCLVMELVGGGILKSYMMSHCGL